VLVQRQGKSKSPCVMKIINIKTYRLNTTFTSHHFFILSKGLNAGKPLEHPCPNCFIIQTKNEEEKGKLFWICYSLWKSEIYHPLLCGSVIPFLHINDVSAEIEKAIQKVSDQPIAFDEAVNQLQHLLRTEKLLETQLKLIAQIKITIGRKLFSSHR
jgi:hypothetical protein